jgi:hypothetical protein
VLAELARWTRSCRGGHPRLRRYRLDAEAGPWPPQARRAFGHAKIQGKSLLVRGLNTLAATISTPLAACGVIGRNGLTSPHLVIAPQRPSARPRARNRTRRRTSQRREALGLILQPDFVILRRGGAGRETATV